jgi:hypothetical protein
MNADAAAEPCNTITCDEPATHVVYWPGKPSRHFCEACKDRALRIAHAMDFLLVTEELPQATAGAVWAQAALERAKLKP